MAPLRHVNRRLKISLLPYETKFTILLIVKAGNFDCRRKLLHSGLKDTINKMNVTQGKIIVASNSENHLVFYL